MKNVFLFHLPNQFRKNCQFKQQPLRGWGGVGRGGGGEYSVFPGKGKNFIWGDLVFYGVT